MPKSKTGDTPRATLTDIAKRSGLLPVICQHCGSRIHTEAALRRFLEEITKALIDGEDVKLPNFGAFKTYVVKGRTITSPLVKGGSIVSEDRRVVKFASSLKLKAALNQDGGSGAEAREDHHQKGSRRPRR